MSYVKWDPNRVQEINGQPVIYNKADKPITQWHAEQGFKKAVHTMHTWMVRYFRLTAAQPDAELQEFELQHIEWELDKIETWLGVMRGALKEQRGEQAKKDTIDKILALADSTTFPEEADAARKLAAKLQGE